MHIMNIFSRDYIVRGVRKKLVLYNTMMQIDKLKSCIVVIQKFMFRGLFYKTTLYDAMTLPYA